VLTGFVTGKLYEPIEQLSLQREGSDILPPFCSAKKFPTKPKEDKLPLLYPECLQALNDANKARHILRDNMVKKKNVIVEIRGEINRLEQDLALEAQTRMRLHAMNEKLLSALREIEKMADDIGDTVVIAHKVPRTSLGGLIEQLKALVKTWRAFKFDQLKTLANDARQGHDKQNDA